MSLGKKLSTTFQWIVSIPVALFGLLLIFGSPAGGILILLSAAVLMPPIAEKLRNVPGRGLLFPALLLTGLVMFGLAAHEESTKREEARLAQEAAEHAEKMRQAELKAKAEAETRRKKFTEQRDTILTGLRTLLEAGNYQAIVDQGAAYTELDQDVASLVNKAQKVLAERAEAEHLAREAAEREAQKQKLLIEIDNLSDTDIQGHITRYQKLIQLTPDEVNYQKELDRLQKLAEANRLAREEAEREAQKQKLLTELDTLPKTDIQGRILRYKKLIQLSPDEIHYQKKLDHFQKIAEVKRQAREAAEREKHHLEVLQKKWHVAKDKSNLDDSLNVYMHVTADNTIPGTLNQPVRPKLWMRCAENTTSFFVDWDVYIHIQNSPMTYRINSKQVQTKSFSVSTDHKALGYFSGRKSIPFIKSLFGANKLLMQVTPYGKNPAQVTFDVSDLEQAIKPLRKACGW